MSVDIKFDMSEVEKFAVELGTWDEKILVEMFRAANVTMDAFQQAVMLRTPVDRGHLRGSIQKVVGGDIAGNIHGEVYTDLVYGWPMERGRKAGRMPPQGVLALWLLRKGIVQSREDAQVAALYLARAIAAGTSAHQRKGGDRMFEKGYADALPAVRRFWDMVPQNIVARLK